MKIRPKIQLFQTGGVSPSGTKKTGILQLDPKGNNIYYNNDWDRYDTWHGSNIIMPWLNNYDQNAAQQADWEDIILKGMDSWNDAGGFDWYNATPELRLHRMLSDSTKTHLQYIIDNLPGLNVEIGKQRSSYNFPSKAFTEDWFDENGSLVGRGGLKTDRDFGILTGNRRPTIHINTDEATTKQWDEYYRKLGYVGKYKYLDHWVPTKDVNKATTLFEGTEDPETPEDGDDLTTLISGEKKPENNFNNLKALFQKVFPNILAAGRLIGNLWNNSRVYDEYLKGIRPDLLQSYHTYRQVVGDEATKLAYYRRAALGQTKAGQPFTSDADRQLAYLMEAKATGDELRALGDLADNQEVRRTSDESNQHQWANILRDTEVANANNKSINYANSLRHNLLALKHSANWTSVDNYLKGIETEAKKKQLRNDAIMEQIFALDLQEKVSNDEEYTNRYLAFSDAWDAAAERYNGDVSKIKADPEVLRAKKSLEERRYQLRRQMLLDSMGNTYYAKKGLKITTKDDLLYKSTRDAVEHFLKMSKLSSDALNRKRIRIEKLTPHPKSTRKMLQGGVAPFTVYTPTVLGGETTVSSQNESSGKSSSSTKDSKNDVLDLLKDLFKNIDGLPVDVNGVFASMQNFLAKNAAFGNELSVEDLSTMYLQQLQQINNIKFSKANFDKAKEHAILQDALDEYAVDDLGRFIALNVKTGEIKFKSWEDIKQAKGEWNPLTNNNLLDLRAYDKKYMLGVGDTALLTVVNKGVGMSKIAAYINSIIPQLGTTEESISGYTKKESDLILSGIEIIKLAAAQGLAASPDGLYLGKYITKSLAEQANMALKYVASMLPKNMTAILKAHSDLQGTNIPTIIGNLIGAKVGSTTSFELSAIIGKAAKGKDGSGNGDSSGDIKSNFLDLIQRDLIGVPRKFSLITREGNSELYSLNSKYISQLPNVTEDMSIEKMLGDSKVGSILDSRLGITFGDLVIAPENLKDVMFDVGGGATVVTLPCRWENGHKVVNFQIKDEFDKAVQEAGKIVPINYLDPRFLKVLSLKLKEKNLNSLVSGDNLDPKMFGHFMVVSAYTTDKINFDKKSKYIEKVSNPDKALEDRIIRGLSTNKDKNNYEIDVDDKFGWFEGTWDDVYRGNVFIPLNNDPVSAQTGWGNDNIKLDETKELANQYQLWNKMSEAKSTNSNLL